jgi:hypothetical protein
VLLWLVGLAVVLGYTRRAREMAWLLPAVYAFTTLLGMKATRWLQRFAVLLVGMIPLAAEAMLCLSSAPVAPDSTRSLAYCLVVITLVAGVPAWFGLVVTIVIRGVEQPRPRRIAPVLAILALLLTWGAALVLLMSRVVPVPPFLGSFS